MSHAASQPPLRLVSPIDSAADSAQQSVAGANRAAAQNPTLDPTDPRWVLAVRTQALLEGSTLTPERRERVLRTAQQLGVRLFDANVIIAIVQDQARRGGSLGDAASSLALLERPNRSQSSGLRMWIAALGAAAVGSTLLIRWLIAG